VIPVNKQLQAVLAMPGIIIENAGLLLDKYHAECAAQQDQKPELLRVTAIAPNDAELHRRLGQHRAALEGLGAIRWTRTTVGPLTLQLSRAGSFENAGICLHPVYGFVFLPGTGIKGLTRAFAETVAGAAAKDIEAVFGKAPLNEEESAAGGVVFYDAWPVQWPRLIVDIVNNHHPDYYQGGDRNAPDDFEDPNPVFFLALASRTQFEFAIGLRERKTADSRLLALAREWLDGALTLTGAGAKTNSGYGRFERIVGRDVTLSSDVGQFQTELKLETPAFLAGANQGKEDCELRPATVRGLLRWWWRTLHSAHLSVSELRMLEAQIWGDTETGGAVALNLELLVLTAEPASYNPRNVAALDRPPDAKTTPGLLYNSYGMQASRGKSSRYYLAPPASWRITLTARSRKGGFTAAQSLEQARLALWLLVRYGGIGAKVRRGFGSFTARIPEAPSNLNDAIERASAVRPRVPEPPQPVSSSIDRMQEKELRLRGNEPWFALDQLGYAYQSFASSEKHRREKLALGLPRRIHKGPEEENLRHPAGPPYRRHASPLHFHVFQDAQGYAVRIAALANPHLPDIATSAAYLKRCIDKMQGWLAKEGGKPAPPARASVCKPVRDPLAAPPRSHQELLR
jgi:CRISPR-associated protein Cmr6